MPGPVMNRNMPRLVLTLASWALLTPLTTGAQTTGAPTTGAPTTTDIPVGMTLTKNGKTVPSAAVRINIADCEGGAELRFNLTASLLGSNSISVVEAWVGSGADAQCALPANRATNLNAAPNCWPVGIERGVTSTVDFDIAVKKLFDRDGKKCPDSRENGYSVYFVPLTSETSQKPSAPPEAVVVPGSPIKAVLRLYTERPAAPTSPSPSSGESTLGLSWKGASNSLVGTKYRVYYEVSGGNGGEAGPTCGAGALMAGAPPPAADSAAVESGAVVRGSTVSGKSDTLDGLDRLGVAIGDEVAAAVATVDIADNESVLSEVVCIERVETEGFYERYQMQGGTGLDTCSAHAQGRTPWTSLGALSVLALALGARRKRAA